jgi:hypothetical protein
VTRFKALQSADDFSSSTNPRTFLRRVQVEGPALLQQVAARCPKGCREIGFEGQSFETNLLSLFEKFQTEHQKFLREIEAEGQTSA